MLLDDPGVLISSGWGMDTQLPFWQIHLSTYTELLLVSHFYAGFIWAAVDRQYLSGLQACQGKANLSKTPLWIQLNQKLAFAHDLCFASWICDGFYLKSYFKVGFALVSHSVRRHSFWQLVHSIGIGIGKTNILIQFSVSKHLFTRACKHVDNTERVDRA